jgi:hypothetical protein
VSEPAGECVGHFCAHVGLDEAASQQAGDLVCQLHDEIHTDMLCTMMHGGR